MSILLPVIIVSGIGLVSGLGLSVASALLDVPSDERAEKVLAELPGINCGACGYSGCAEYAKAVASGEADTTLCIPGRDKTAQAISKVMGVDAGKVQGKNAVVYCAGTRDKTDTSMEWNIRG